jgi:hypothetical protein
MADNVTLNAMTGGDVAAADEIGGVKYQRIKNGFGADGVYNEVAEDLGLPVAPARLVVTGSATANNTDLISMDVAAYKWVTIQSTGTFVATLTFQFSNDGITWVTPNATFYDVAGGTFQNSVTLTGKFIMAPLSFRYFRVRTSTYTSGTPAVTVLLTSVPPTWVPSAPTIVDSELPGAASLADAASNPVAPTVGAAGMVYNGATWDRMRNVATIDGAAGSVGLPAAAAVGYDSAASVNRRIRADAVGSMYVRPFGTSTSAVTSVSGATSSTSLLAAKLTRAQATFYNDSTANLYLKLGATASTTSFTVKIAAGGYYELPTAGGVYTGAVDGIWDAANGAVRITEVG